MTTYDTAEILNVPGRQNGERILREATFSPDAQLYSSIVVSIAPAAIAVVCTLTIVLIPVALLLGAGIYGVFWYYERYYTSLRVILTSRDLKVYRGVLNREEKSIPLEKITDLAVFQGPIMRYFDLKGIRVETAGQTNRIGALVSVVGIENVDEFRDTVLDQRDHIADTTDSHPAATPPTSASSPDAPVLAALTSIHETLQRIEKHVSRQDNR